MTDIRIIVGRIRRGALLTLASLGPEDRAGAERAIGQGLVTSDASGTLQLTIKGAAYNSASRQQRMPGDRVRKLTLLRRVKGPTPHQQTCWDVRCDCGVTLDAVVWGTIMRRGHCGCETNPSAQDIAEASFSEIVASGFAPTRQAVQNCEIAAMRRFEDNWTHWRLIHDTDPETASFRDLQRVVLSCRYLLKQLDNRQRKEMKANERS